MLLPGVVLPALLFLVLHGCPYIERRLTGPRPEQHLCGRPRDQPTRTAPGAAAVSGYGACCCRRASRTCRRTRSACRWSS
ncbi:hypothetical protein [Streptomyces cinerochromogenes]|uniref:hypothetical protein n=1 Tax=Streptomyces cinerochromogenes TaxID=66422 RepID=UPI001E5AB11E|nr:hypothetical protein [Streptomyces cinerochromogenes]